MNVNDILNIAGISKDSDVTIYFFEFSYGWYNLNVSNYDHNWYGKYCSYIRKGKTMELNKTHLENL